MPTDKQLSYASHLIKSQDVSAVWYAKQPTHNKIYTNKKANYVDQIIIDNLRKLDKYAISALIDNLLNEDERAIDILLTLNN